MNAAAFEYFRPATLAEACAMLSDIEVALAAHATTEPETTP